MSIIRLGRRTARLEINLTPNAAFVSEIDTSDGTAWTVGTVAELRFSGPTLGYSDTYSDDYGTNDVWPAITSGDTLRWGQSVEDVNALIAKAPTEAQLWDNDALPQRWARGDVTIETP